MLILQRSQPGLDPVAVRLQEWRWIGRVVVWQNALLANHTGAC